MPERKKTGLAPSYAAAERHGTAEISEFLFRLLSDVTGEKLAEAWEADPSAMEHCLSESRAEVRRLREELEGAQNAAERDARAAREHFSASVAALEAQRDALAEAVLDLWCAEVWTDTYCTFCEAHAPTCDAGPIGPIPHGEDCARAAVEAALARVGRLS